jgi:phosphate transport system substrate-binding protein
VVNPDAGVTNIGRAALRQVLAGHIRWWSQLGGAHRPIIVVARPLGSGARYVVDHAIMGGQRLTSGAIVQLSNGAVMATVAETPGALGFVERRPDTASVALLAVDGRRFDPKDPRAWPFWAYPRLYYRSDAPVLVRELADDLAHNPRRQAFDIYDAVAAR